MNDSVSYESFGKFFKAKREEAGLSLRETAKFLSVSPAYLSSVENDKSAPLTSERLMLAADLLHLNQEDRYMMYDLAGEQRNTVAPDILEYILGRDYIAEFLRATKDYNEEDWKKLMDELIELKKQNMEQP